MDDGLDAFTLGRHLRQGSTLTEPSSDDPVHVSKAVIHHIVTSALPASNVVEVEMRCTNADDQSLPCVDLYELPPNWEECVTSLEGSDKMGKDWCYNVAIGFYAGNTQTKCVPTLARILRGQHAMSEHLPEVDEDFAFHMWTSEFMGTSQEAFTRYWKKWPEEDKRRWGDSGQGKAVLGHLQQHASAFAMWFEYERRRYGV